MQPPLAYFITFRCYGTWLPGAAPHWLRRGTATRPARYEPPDPALLRRSLRCMRAAPARLDRRAQQIVAASIRDTCAYRGWTLWELHVDAVHVHVVVTAPWAPSKVMGTLKSWATRRLREAGAWTRPGSPWQRRGYKRWVGSEGGMARVRRYVREEQ